MKILNKISNWWKDFKSNYKMVEYGIDNVYRAPVVQENIRDQEAVKRVKKAFEAQQQELSARALKPHDANCKDPLTCKKKICFRPVADKIVSQFEMSVESVRKDQIKRAKKN